MHKINLQRFAVFPVHGNTFKVGRVGRSSVGADMVTIKDIETFEPAIDGNIEEWNPMDMLGWVRRMKTGNSLSITLNGKRNHGDPGNDYVAGTALLTGSSVETVFEWTMPSGAVLTMNCIVNATSFGGGDSTAVNALEVEIMSDGIPTLTETALGVLTFVCSDHATAGATQIASVSPVLGGSNNYKYKINGGIPAYGTILDATWVNYTLAAAIPVNNGNMVTLVEVVTATSAAVKGGQSVAIVT